jgi:uncharacterized protein (DUF433 family)
MSTTTTTAVSDPGKTHYRKAFKSPYLGSADVVEPIVVTIKSVQLLDDLSKQSKDQFNTAHFAERFIRPGEPMKPMILNATNCRLLSELTGSKYIEDWAGARVMIKIDPNVRYGKETVEGLRLAKAPNVACDMRDERQEQWREAARTGGTDAAGAFFKAMSREEREFSKMGLRVEVWVIAEKADADAAAARNAEPPAQPDTPASEPVQGDQP